MRILVDEQEPDRAWEAAVRYGASDSLWLDLARRRGQEHPDDAAGVYHRLVEQAIAGKDRQAYREAASLLGELRTLLAGHDRLAEFDAALEGVRRTHARKKALLDELRRAQARWADAGPTRSLSAR